MSTNPTSSSAKDDDDPDELGWAFNNEINYALLELDTLDEAEGEIKGQGSAHDKRLENINAIKNFINRKKG